MKLKRTSQVKSLNAKQSNKISIHIDWLVSVSW